VSAPAALRIKRVIDRDGLSREEIMKRINRQVNEEMKMKLCDFIIYNNEEQAVIPQVAKLDEQFKNIVSH
jgi:dephospho-CoA kinase